MSNKELTIKQENFCQAYIRTGNKTEAYREAYNCSNMKTETINERASRLSNECKISARIEQLQQEVIERNKITVDELVQTLASAVRFDIADLYDENGSLKSIHDIPKEARQMITQIDVFEESIGHGEDKQVIGHTKKIKLIDRNVPIEKLMKHLGGYEKDNSQKKTDVAVNVSGEFDEVKQKRLEELAKKALNIKD